MWLLAEYGAVDQNHEPAWAVSQSQSERVLLLHMLAGGGLVMAHQGNAWNSEAPWRANGLRVRDAEGDVIAIAVKETDAKLMAAAVRFADWLYVWLAMNTTWREGKPCPKQADWYWPWQEARKILVDAGQSLPPEPAAVR